MFKRYNEKARRTIFFARYEASQFGSPYIESEHLLLGLLREDKVLATAVLEGEGHVGELWKKVEAHSPVREKVATSVDLPVSNECKRVMAYAAEEAARMGHQHIGTEHLFLGLLREERSYAAALLNEYGMSLEKGRLFVAQLPHSTAERIGVDPEAAARTGRGYIGPLHHQIEFRVGNKIIGTAPLVQQVPRAGESVHIAQPLTPGKFDSYRVVEVTSEYVHAGEVPPPLALRLAKVIVQLEPLDSGEQDVK